MKDNLMQNSQGAADTAQAGNIEEEAAAALGKFKDVKALMDAYTALEAEFTRRSQRLKELEANKETKATAPDAGSATQKEAGANPQAVSAANAEVPSQAAGESPAISDQVKNAVIAEYLNGLRQSRVVPILSGGGAVTATRRTATNLKEAGALAKYFFDNKEDK